MRSFFFLLLAATLTSHPCPAQQTNISVEPGVFHLGTKTVKSFPEQARPATGPRLERTFESQANATEWTLSLKERNVIDDWAVEINGQPIARLNITDSERVANFAIPPRSLIDGTNILSIVPRERTNDILVGAIEIFPKRMRDLLKLAHVTLNVTDGNNPVPARVTIVNAGNHHADLYNVKPDMAAWRRGLFYTGGQQVEFDIPQGEWILTATRGIEWSHKSMKLKFFIGQNTRLTLPLVREVATPGYIAADTHVHTYTFSGHGDASVKERIWTLAGEGVELAIATDHNHFTDYAPIQESLGASSFFTSVIGNEVTTGNGHFNAFPFKTDSIKPNYKETNWVKLVADIRSKGAQYVILNHPRWPAITNSPFSIWGLNRGDGSRTNTSVEFTMDAIEVQNSSFPVPPKDPNFVLRDWFALLNRGEHLWAVGASDSHTVSDPPGQGRTYIASQNDEPAAIDVNAAIKSMRAGNMSVSYGIFATATVNGRTMGQTTKPSRGNLDVKFHVACPEWVKAKKAVIYINGVQVAEQELQMAPRAALSTNLFFSLPAPKHDGYIVCVAYGEGVKDIAWKTMADFTHAITNPIFIDADEDGKYSSPRETALAFLKGVEPLTAADVEKFVSNADAAIGMQIMSEAKLRLPAAELPAWDRLLEKLSETNDLYKLYRKPPPSAPAASVPTGEPH